MLYSDPPGSRPGPCAIAAASSAVTVQCDQCEVSPLSVDRTSSRARVHCTALQCTAETRVWRVRPGRRRGLSVRSRCGRRSRSVSRCRLSRVSLGQAGAVSSFQPGLSRAVSTSANLSLSVLIPPTLATCTVSDRSFRFQVLTQSRQAQLGHLPSASPSVHPTSRTSRPPASPSWP